MRFVVAQSGARRGYAVPMLLDRVGMLERFYTGLSASAGCARLLRHAVRLPLLREPLKRVGRRIIPHELTSKTRSFEWQSIPALVRSRINASDPENQFRILSRNQQRIGNAMV